MNTELKTISVFSVTAYKWSLVYVFPMEGSVAALCFLLCILFVKELHSPQSSVYDYGNINSCIVLNGLRYGSVRGGKIL